MWLEPLFARTLKNVKSGFRKWLEDLPLTDVVLFLPMFIDLSHRHFFCSQVRILRYLQLAKFPFYVKYSQIADKLIPHFNYTYIGDTYTWAPKSQAQSDKLIEAQD
jgi:hypothetical protein